MIRDLEPKQSLEEIPDDASQPSYREEEPTLETSDASLPSRQRNWMDTWLCTRMQAGGSRRYYQQFGSSTDSDEDSLNTLLSSAQVETNKKPELAVPPEPPAIRIAELPLTPPHVPDAFSSEHELIEAHTDEQNVQTQPSIIGTGTSLRCTSAPLLTNPSFIDVPSNFPIWPQLDHPIANDLRTTAQEDIQNAMSHRTGTDTVKLMNRSEN